LPDPFDLFDEYAAAYARGERPSAEAFLARAGAGADELAGMLETLVVSAPAPGAAEVAELETFVAGKTPLERLRAERGFTRDRTVDLIVERFGFARTKRDKVKRYYRQLEAGLLEWGRVDVRLRQLLTDAFAAPPAPVAAPLFAAWRPRPARAQARPTAFFRSAEAAAAPVPSATPEPAGAFKAGPQERDEIDRLFLGT
jgi:hypothetical protein